MKRKWVNLSKAILVKRSSVIREDTSIKSNYVGKLKDLHTKWTRMNNISNQIKSNQITFIVTSPQHKCLGEWNSYERAPDSAGKQQTIYLWTDSAKNCTGAFTVLQTVQKNNNSNLHMDRQCKKATAIYIWTVHIYRLYRRQCAKYTYIYSVHIVYYKDILNYQRHIIHRMGTSALCTVSIHNVVYA